MNVGQFLLLVSVGAVANAINSVAGGGSLISFPYLTFGMHLPGNVANATNTSSLWPGSLAGTLGFANLLPAVRGAMRRLIGPTLVGAVGGAFLFVRTDVRVFDAVVPWLILFAALLLMLQPKVKALVQEHRGGQLSPTTGWIVQFLVSVYGGYFGAGMGIMMLAAFALTLDATLHEMNAVKSFLGTFINLTATVVFFFQGVVRWDVALPLALGSVIGGFLAARWSQRMHPERLRIAIAVYGVGMSLYYFWRTHSG